MAFLRIMATLGLDGRGFATGLKGAERAAQSASNRIRNYFFSAFSIAFVTQATRATVKWGSEINDLAKRASVSNKMMQILGHSAKQTGSDMNEAAAALTILSQKRADALKDSKSDAGKLFDFLGLGPDALKNMDVEAIFRQIAEQFRTRNFGANAANIAKDLFGRGGAALIPLMTEGLDKFEEEMKRLGILVEDKTIEGLDRIGDAWDRLIARVRGPFADQLVRIADFVSDIVDDLNRGLATLKDFQELTGQDKRKATWLEKLFGFQDISSLATGLTRKKVEPSVQQEMANRAFAREGAAALAAASKILFPQKAIGGPVEEPDLTKEEKIKKIKERKVESDELARIGGFIGGTARIQSTQERQERHLANVARHTQRMAERGVKLEGQP